MPTPAGEVLNCAFDFMIEFLGHARLHAIAEPGDNAIRKFIDEIEQDLESSSRNRGPIWVRIAGKRKSRRVGSLSSSISGPPLRGARSRITS